MENSIIFIPVGIISGLLAGLMGIGGGNVLVPVLVILGLEAKQAAATSIIAIVITSISGSIQNYRMGYLDTRKVLGLGLPSLLTAQIGVQLANYLPSYLLLFSFGIFLLINILLGALRRRLAQREPHPITFINPILARIGTGGVAGILAGLFGIGGGVIMVPLQMLWLGEPIKTAIQTSLGVIVITAISAGIGHTISGNVLFIPGILLGLGGLFGVQVSTRFLPKLPDQTVNFVFYCLLSLLSLSVFWQAWNIYQSQLISP